MRWVGLVSVPWLLLAVVAVLCGAGAIPPGETVTSLGRLPKCCDRREQPTDLWECVLNATKENAEEILNGGGDVELVLTTMVTANLVPYAAYSMAVAAAWAEHHGYVFRIFTEKDGSFEETDARWNKVRIVRTAITEYAPQTKYAMWIDADLTFIDFQLSVKTIVNAAPGADFWMCAENYGSSTYFNSGSFVVRNTDTAKQILDRWWDVDSRYLHSDQENLDKIKDEFAGKIAVLRPNFFNTDPPAMTNMGPSDQVLHLMGETTSLRARQFGYAFDEVCSAHEQSRPHRHQLGLTQARLIEDTIETHMREHGAKLRNAERLKPSEELEKVLLGLQLNGHPLQHALNAQGKHSEAQNVKLSSFGAIDAGLRAMRDTGYKVSPELVKRKVVLGINFIDEIGSADVVEKLYKDLNSELDLLEQIVRPEQLNPLRIMRGDLDQNKALSHIHRQEWRKAIDHVKKAVKAFDHDSVGAHNKAKPLGTLASLLCQTERYDEAYPIFDKVLGIQMEHLGPDHRQVGVLRLNSGICKFHGQDYELALRDLSEARRIYTHNHVPPENDEFRRITYFLQEAAGAGAKTDL
mmetsp:Transcript_11795/g.35968  ORF Transcript_11795/g.35968 Transcript_11795/m.35968 type:complete len:579 (-) Transcript_11795:81-1817(-)|eukprot:CAMPEP_0198735544 /NCGR_PEP_ID=MMETSP1475-20131203/60342_1 /TAXON_ID= ORGANISM="Unidentified sp., Strain CCMP1999" /NCGR_SAMPLE_ID=MMETSP1475 /ASSEMBLY_ACC=CAM_ASM_001111 /LENGTH=578 /DNA_ID=CAMNT_0044499221 /DNA_START=86 /DNA_END=1822 /DNA_ORIENTATION=-